uniref:Pyridoxamine 5'-phosphate oxidase N-terminal domain-containing protein n=1 Tax=Craspedostauros australis TaxID=1486917 RepID=A0A7R9ZS91_9STRA|mmetsp:Transcript_8138/g.22081  ORF Transcript_8138/g.22081 Transcript_8138/m.22081 type:complete len:268 (+) Transcript_8138:203-1006(+)|eukprot:CAMPEP_0198119340 /NCGR_PEP_ID=MMETSP1442-20131203/25190_1 /TAXON_ID= /ORGANISM="Craspedostauros australis, Strain CCMP3328" /LENGTH=267 /DNA_ID=CAMNT_0043777785 /DNA_START=159 /DNA_END=962 /DNA_ORIENTATION=+
MGKVLQEITSNETKFIAKQKVFFVATAPSSDEHHVNVSPKGAANAPVVVLGPHKVAYLDLTGSGAETSAHVLQNGRITLLFCNLEQGPPKLLRLYGTAKLVVKERAASDLLDKFAPVLLNNKGFRGIFVIDVHRISTSCGYSMPIMGFEKYRTTLDDLTGKWSPQAVQDYSIKKNSFSIDGLPSISHQRHGDKKLVPYAEDGYIFGKEGDGDDAKLQAMQLAKQNNFNSQGNSALPRMLLIFLLGLAVGACGMQVYQQQQSVAVPDL